MATRNPAETHQLRLVVEIPIIYKGLYIQTVLVSRISEPSTSYGSQPFVRNPFHPSINRCLYIYILQIGWLYIKHHLSGNQETPLKAVVHFSPPSDCFSLISFWIFPVSSRRKWRNFLFTDSWHCIMEVSLFKNKVFGGWKMWKLVGSRRGLIPPVCFLITGMNSNVFMETSEKVADVEDNFGSVRKSWGQCAVCKPKTRTKVSCYFSYTYYKIIMVIGLQ